MTEARPKLYKEMKVKNMSKKAINVGFVGVGEFIKGNHLPNLCESERFNVRWLCDLNAELLEKRKKEFDVENCTTDIEELLSDPTIELVIIGTRQDMRLPLIEKCAKAGKNIFVEKPMSLTSKESESIIELIRKAGVRLQVGYNRRSAPIIKDAKSLYSEFKKRAKNPAIITYRAVDESYLWPDWAFDKQHGGKVFHEGCHFFDLACYLTDQFPVSIYSAGKISDNQVTTLNFPDGTIFSVVNSGEGCNAYPKERMEIFCGWNTVIMENFIELTVVTQSESKVKHYPVFREKGKLSNKIYMPDEFNKLAANWRKNITEEEFKAKHYYSSMPIVDKGHMAQFNDIANALIENKPFPCNEISGAQATYICKKCIESIKTGKTVSVDQKFLEKIL